MRAHNAEHLDSLPILDVSALKHIAYVFDALIYYMRSGTESPDSDVLRDGLPVESWNDQVKKTLNFCLCEDYVQDGDLR
jgi:E3 ubiquitin-protein ligase EDD1